MDKRDLNCGGEPPTRASGATEQGGEPIPYIQASLIACKFCDENAIQTYEQPGRHSPFSPKKPHPLCMKHRRLANLIKKKGFKSYTQFILLLDGQFDPYRHYIERLENPPRPSIRLMTDRERRIFYHRILKTRPPAILSKNPKHPVCVWCNERKPPKEFVDYPHSIHPKRPICKDCRYDKDPRSKHPYKGKDNPE